MMKTKISINHEKSEFSVRHGDVEVAFNGYRVLADSKNKTYIMIYNHGKSAGCLRGEVATYFVDWVAQ